MSDVKFKKHKFISYLTIGLTLFVCWAGINYYSISQQEQSTLQNVQMIEEEVVAIQVEQYQLMEEQLVIIEEIPTATASRPPRGGSLISRIDPTIAPVMAAPTPTPMVISPEEERFVELDNEIAEREEIEAELLAELEAEKITLGESFLGLKQISKMDVTNPIVNILILPLVGWFIKRLIDFGFARLEDRYDHHEV